MSNKKKLSISSYISSIFMDLYSIEPLVGVLLSKFKIEEDNSLDTMGVTHDTLYYNKEFVKGLDRSELLFVLYHELMHIALMHVDKNSLGNLNKKLYNIACDLYINKYIIDTQFSGVLENKVVTIKCVLEARDIALKVLYNKDGNFSGMYEDWVDVEKDNIYIIYNKLNNNKSSSSYLSELLKEHDQVMGTDYSSNDMNLESILDKVESELLNGRAIQTRLDKFVKVGDLLGSGDLTPDELSKLKGMLQDSLKDCANMERNFKRDAGMSKGCLNRLVSELLKPKVSWKKIITKELLAFKREDITYNKLDTRFSYLDLNLPDLDKIDIGCLSNISVAIDVSGSISREVYNQFMSDTINLFKQYKADGELLHWDTEITAKGKILENNLRYMSNLEVRGGGGTTTDCVFNYYDSLGKHNKPSLSIILTDGYIYMNNQNSWYRDYKKTIWIISEDGDKNFKPPFGKVVFM